MQFGEPQEVAPCAPLLGPLIQSQRSVEREHANVLVLELTRRCNLRCVHCYADAGPYEGHGQYMTLGRWKSVIHWGRNNGFSQLQFIGGEPTLHPHLRDLLAEAWSAAYEGIEVFSNAVSIKDDLIQLLGSVGARVAVSIYGALSGTHDRMTNVNGSHTRTWRTLQKLVSAGIEVRVAIVGCTMSTDEIASILSQLRRIGIGDASVHAIQSVGRGASLRNEATGSYSGCGSCGLGTICVSATGHILPCVFMRSQPVGMAGEGRFAGMF